MKEERGNDDGKNSERIIGLILENPNISIKELSINIEKSESTIERTIKKT